MQRIKNLGKRLSLKSSKAEIGFKPLSQKPQSTRRIQKKNFRQKLYSASWKFVAAIIFLVAVLVFLKSPLFAVNTINCKTQYSLCSDTDQKLLDSFKGQNLIFLKTHDVEAKITQSFANRKIVVQKSFPGTLSVFLERRKPYVAIRVADSPDGVFLVDNEGVIVEYSKTSSLPAIITSEKSPLVVGESVDSNTLQAIKIMQLVYKSQKATEGLLHDAQLDIKLSDGALAIFPLDRDPQVSVGALQLITARIRIDGKVPKSIDLRYSNPVLSY